MIIMYRLTKEGEKYLKKGLPEQNLIKILKKVKKARIDELKEKVENFEIAVKWAKEKNWIEIKEGYLKIKKVPKKFEELEGLKNIKENKKIKESLEKILIRRRLIEKVDVESLELEKKFKKKTIDQIDPKILKYKIWKVAKDFKKYDINSLGKKFFEGRLNPYLEFISEIKKKLVGLGFEEAKGPIVELNFWNCDCLFMPSDHPARSIHDIFYLKLKDGKVLDKELWGRVEEVHKNGWITKSKGWGKWDFNLARKIILRSQTTSVSARKLYEIKNSSPYKIFTIGKVFRPESIDAKHHLEFDQCEGIVIDENLNFRNLLGYIKEIVNAILGEKKVRFKPTYFPFTEPSVEGYVYHEKLGWIEFVGAGIFRPEVTLPLGSEKPVLAWGIGLTRLAMIKLNIDDIREIYSTNIQNLRNFKMVR